MAEGIRKNRIELAKILVEEQAKNRACDKAKQDADPGGKEVKHVHTNQDSRKGKRQQSQRLILFVLNVLLEIIQYILPALALLLYLRVFFRLKGLQHLGRVAQ